MYIIKFYGIKCRARITADSFELFGKTKVTQFLLDCYFWVILRMIEVNSFICGNLGIEYTTDFRLDVIEEVR